MIQLRSVFKLCSICLFIVTPLLAEEDVQEALQKENTTGWRVSGGLMYRSMDSVSITTRSRVSEAMLPHMPPPSFNGDFSRFGDPDAPADREYDNGYVRQDRGTQRDGDTWYWGYDNAGQVQGNSLVFKGLAGQQTYSGRDVLSPSIHSSEEDDDGAGFYIKALREIKRSDRYSMHLLVSASHVPFSVENGGSTFDIKQRDITYDVTVVDRYDLMGVTPPDAPYAGNSDGPGPLLPNTPASREITQTEVSRSDTRYFNEIHQKLDISVTSLDLGLQGEYDVGTVQLTTAAGISFNMIRTDGDRSEDVWRQSGGTTSRFGHYTDSEHEMDFALGAFLQAGVRYLLNKRIGLELGVQYDVSDPVSGDLGPSSYEVDLDGLSMLAMVGVAL